MNDPNSCPFCEESGRAETLIDGELCRVIPANDQVLVGSVMIVPKAHRETAFDLAANEWAETQELLAQVKARLDAEHSPDGYNIGWNVGEAGGMSVPHAHLHVIPRYADEPLAGKGIRHHLKQEENRRGSQD